MVVLSRFRQLSFNVGEQRFFLVYLQTDAKRDQLASGEWEAFKLHEVFFRGYDEVNFLSCR